MKVKGSLLFAAKRMRTGDIALEPISEVFELAFDTLDTTTQQVSRSYLPFGFSSSRDSFPPCTEP